MHTTYQPRAKQVGAQSTQAEPKELEGTPLSAEPMHLLICALLPTYTAHPKPAQPRCPSPAEFLRPYTGKPTYMCIPLVSTKPYVQVERA